MWYVIWTYTGREEQTRDLIEDRVPHDLYSRISVPYMEKIEMIGKSRRIVQKLMIPSYIFIDTDRVVELHEALRKLNVFANILHNGELFLPLDGHDEFVINKLTKDGDTVRISHGFMDGDKVRITSGPLKGLDAYIKRVYPRKATAVIEMTVFDRSTEVKVGLEILKKPDDKE